MLTESLFRLHGLQSAQIVPQQEIYISPLSMTGRSPFPFTACLDHAHYRCREVVTLSAGNHNYKSGKSLEQRQSEITIMKEKHPDELPVIVQKADKSQIPYAKKKLLIRAQTNLADFFVEVWNKIFKIEVLPKDCKLFMLIRHKDPIFEKMMSTVYQEYKNEDGCLYITLSGEIRDVLPESIPSDISTSTIYLTELPYKSKSYYEVVHKDGYVDLIGKSFDDQIKKCMEEEEWFREYESEFPSPHKLGFYLVAAGLKHKSKLIKQFYESVIHEEGRIDMDNADEQEQLFRLKQEEVLGEMVKDNLSDIPEINNGVSRNKYETLCWPSVKNYYLGALVLFLLWVYHIYM